MRKCSQRAASFCRRPVSTTHLSTSALHLDHRHANRAHSKNSRGKGNRTSPPRKRAALGNVFWQPSAPERVSRWIAQLEPVFPTQLQDQHYYKQTETGLADDAATVTPDAHDVAEIVLSARRLDDIDILTCLGVERGRWRALVWLVEYLVENVGTKNRRGDRASELLWPWANSGSLRELTLTPVEISRTPPDPHRGIPDSLRPRTLRSLTDGLAPGRLSTDELLRHDTLGQIWRSLGAMTLLSANAGDPTASQTMPKVLEIIAFLHHSGIMPASIYSYTSTQDDTALRQPPILNILFSRILTSLSDAAWRAHESLVIEEAKSKGEPFSSIRPRIRGAAYRVRVGGLTPEVWLELILWSCLHGGWITEGAAILDLVCQLQGNIKWSPLSWREVVRPMLPAGHEHELSWDQIRHYFDTKATSDGDTKAMGRQRVTRTISAEIVVAYVDALINSTRVGVGARGVPPGIILVHLKVLKNFLRTSGLSLGSGSWDAIVLRLVESQGMDIEREPVLAEHVAALSEAIGWETKSKNTQRLPTYVLDGTAATFGLLHRALHAHIASGNIEGALRVFKRLQQRIDHDKRQSMLDFFGHLQDHPRAYEPPSDEHDFSMYFTGIEYPTFNIRLPATILGPFLDLVTEAEAFAFGSWLLNSEDLDGPVIPQGLYANPIVAAALVRFATAANDVPLLSKVHNARANDPYSPVMPAAVLQSYLDSQINLERWESVNNILTYVRDTPGYSWNMVNAANLVRVMLRRARRSGHDGVIKSGILQEPAKILAKLMTYRHGSQETRDIFSLVTLMSCIDTRWAEYGLSIGWDWRSLQFYPSQKVFNTVLEGVVDLYGSTAGRRLLGSFWTNSKSARQNSGRKVHAQQGGVPTMPRFEPRALDKMDITRFIVQLPGISGKRVVFRGGFTPDFATFRVILRKALDEYNEATTSERGASGTAAVETAREFDADSMNVRSVAVCASATGEEFGPFENIVWAVKCFKSFGLLNTDIRSELGDKVSEVDLEAIGKSVFYGQSLWWRLAGESDEESLQQGQDALETAPVTDT